MPFVCSKNTLTTSDTCLSPHGELDPLSVSHKNLSSVVYYLGTLGKATFNFVASSCSFLLRCPPPTLPSKEMLSEGNTHPTLAVGSMIVSGNVCHHN